MCSRHLATPWRPTSHTHHLLHAHRAADALGIKFILTIGLRVTDIKIPMEMVGAWKRYIKRSNIHSIEVGNEPDHLAKRGERPAGYSYADYSREYRAFSKGIRDIFPDIPLMGPGYAYEWRDEHQVQFMQDEVYSTRYVSIHRYQLFGCAKGNTLDMLLNSESEEGGAAARCFCRHGHCRHMAHPDPGVPDNPRVPTYQPRRRMSITGSSSSLTWPGRWGWR
jgi:hypothetical protein